MGEYFEEILRVLRELFPAHLIVTEETAGGYTSPCLLVQKKETKLKRANYFRWNAGVKLVDKEHIVSGQYFQHTVKYYPS